MIRVFFDLAEPGLGEEDARSGRRGHEYRGRSAVAAGNGDAAGRQTGRAAKQFDLEQKWKPVFRKDHAQTKS
jgi:hypothetical protein